MLLSTLFFACTASALTLGSRDDSPSTSLTNTRDEPPPARHGACGVHVRIDHHPNKYGTLITTTVKDALGIVMGAKSEVVHTNYESVVKTSLPYDFFVVNENDLDTVSFRYGQDAWRSDEGNRCSVGNSDWKYHDSSVDMDCGFAC